MSIKRGVPSAYSKTPNQYSPVPDDFIQEVRERVSIRDVIGSHVNLKKAGPSLVGLCPFHSEKSPSFSVSETKKVYYCFGCGQSGDALTFLMNFAGLTFREALEETAGMVNMQLPQAGNAPVENYSEIYKRLDLAFKFFKHCLAHTESAKTYLKSRGVIGDTLKTFSIGYAPTGWQSLMEPFGEKPYAEDPDLVRASLVKEKDGRRYDVFRDRLIFAIRDTRGRIIGFGGRSMDGSEPKYLNSPESPVFNKSSVLFGFHEARSSIMAEKQVIVVEGYMDVVMLAQKGVKHVVATMGTACTPDQIERLCAVAPVTVFTFDGDTAGRRAAWRALENCLPFVKESHEFRFCLLPDGFDPDELVQEEGSNAFLDRVNSASGLTQFFVSELAHRHGNLETPEDRARFLAAGSDMILRLPQGSFFGRILREEVAKAAHVGPTYLTTLRKSQRRSSNRSDIWNKLCDAVHRFPFIANPQVMPVLDALDDEEYGLLESETFSGEHEKNFWESFLALPEMALSEDPLPQSAEEVVLRDTAVSLKILIAGQLKKQKRLRLSSQYRKGDISESQFIEARGSQ